MLTVIIPTYRGERFLHHTLDSVLGQTLSDLECIVVDDGSDDGTRSIIEAYARTDRRVTAIYQRNSGGSAARNRGFDVVGERVEYVAFLDQDDVWEPDALELLVEALREDRAAAGAHGVVRLIDDSGLLCDPGRAERRTGKRLELADGRLAKCAARAPTTFNTLILRDILLTPGNVLVRRAFVERVGGYDPSLHWNADWDFALRLTSLAHLAFVHAPVLRYRKHADGMSYRPEASEMFERERLEVMRKLSVSVDITEQQRRVVRAADELADVLESRFLADEALASLDEQRWGRALRLAQSAVYARAKGVVRPRFSRTRLMKARRALDSGPSRS